MKRCEECLHLDVCNALESNNIAKVPPIYCGCFKEAADVVEVVRCKECKHFISEVCRHDFAMNLSRGDDFCSYGERKGQK